MCRWWIVSCEICTFLRVFWWEYSYKSFYAYARLGWHTYDSFLYEDWILISILHSVKLEPWPRLYSIFSTQTRLQMLKPKEAFWKQFSSKKRGDFQRILKHYQSSFHHDEKLSRKNSHVWPYGLCPDCFWPPVNHHSWYRNLQLKFWKLGKHGAVHPSLFHHCSNHLQNLKVFPMQVSEIGSLYAGSCLQSRKQ